ncbi:MAG: polysaccharide deacetylase family protein [Pseudohongiella sp.]|nr:polysaccharide deacetylase family protein [Pseudohongiella sp.]
MAFAHTQDSPGFPTMVKKLALCMSLAAVSVLSSNAGMAQTAPSPEGHAVITIYHHVSDSTPRSTSLTPEELRIQMQYLQDNNFEVWPLDRLIAALQNKEPLPEKTAALTFDDAYISIYDTGWPMLQEFGFPMTLFVSTQPINDNQRGYMNWDQIREMAEGGVIIANHMVHHPHMVDALPGESNEDRLARLRAELLEAQEDIRTETGQDHKIMAYPYGEFDDDITAIIEELGYVALAQNSGAVGYYSDFTALPRYPLAASFADIESASTKLNSLAFQVLEHSPRTPGTDSKNPAVTLRLAGDFNVSQLGCYANGQRMELEWIDREAVHFRIQPAQEFQMRRFGYICTAPKRGTNRYYWFNKLWIRSTPDNAD